MATLVQELRAIQEYLGYLLKYIEQEEKNVALANVREFTKSRDLPFSGGEDDVIRHYLTHHPRARPTAGDRKLVAERFSDGFSAEDLMAAIDGCHRSPWHCGENDQRRKYQRLSLICKDADHVQMFIEIPAQKQVNQQSRKNKVESLRANYHRYCRNRGVEFNESRFQELAKRIG